MAATLGYRLRLPWLDPLVSGSTFSGGSAGSDHRVWIVHGTNFRIGFDTLVLIQESRPPRPPALTPWRPFLADLIVAHHVIMDCFRVALSPETDAAAAERWPTEPPLYNPRDQFGNPIERWRSDDMTMAQRRVTYSEPKYVTAREEALAAEAAEIAAQSAADGVAPDPGIPKPVRLPPVAPC